VSVLSVALAQLPAGRDFALADHTLPTRPKPAWQQMAQSPLKGTAQPVDSEEGGLPLITDRQCMAEMKRNASPDTKRWYIS